MTTPQDRETRSDLRVAVAAGLGAEEARSLLMDASGLMCQRIMLVHPWDVTLLVLLGGVDAGVVPKHVLAEQDTHLYEVVDLGCGNERLVYAGAEVPARRRLRVATRYPGLTRRHFEAAGRQVEIVCLEEAEIACELDLADGAVLPLPAGVQATHAGLPVREHLLESSLRVVVGGAGRLIHGSLLREWFESARVARDIGGQGPRAGDGSSTPRAAAGDNGETA